MIDDVNLQSLSSRRAWIEIRVASGFFAIGYSRSPRGERGLKFVFVPIKIFESIVALLAESVD